MPTRTISLPIQGLDDHDSVAIDDLYVTNLRNVRSDRSRIVASPGGTLLAPAPGAFGGFTDVGVAMGTFTQKTTGTGAQVISHSLGVTPKALLIFGGGPGSTSSPTLDSAVNGYGFSVGFYDGTTQRTIGSASASASEAADPTFSDAANRYANAIYTQLAPQIALSGATLCQASVSAMSATTFTLNWTTNDNKARTISYIALGSAGISAKLVEWTYSQTSANQAVTGAGFIPQLVLHLTCFRDSLTGGPFSNGNFSGSRCCLGAMTTVGQWFAAEEVQTGGMDFATWINTGNCLGWAFGGPLQVLRAKYVSMDADGFTVSKTQVQSSGFPNFKVVSLCLTGLPNVHLGLLPTTLATVPTHSSTTGVGFKPQLVLQVTNGIGSTAAPQLGSSYGIGLTDGSNQYTLATSQRQNAGPISQSYVSTVQTEVQLSQVTSGTKLIGSIYSLDSDGFTLNYVQASESAAPNGVYLALVATGTTPASQIGVIRNYGDLIVGGTTPIEKIVMLTSKSAFVYSPQTTSTGIWTPTAEAYTGTDVQRFSIANGTDATYGAVAAWSQGKDNIRYYDGSAFGALITSGTNHAARVVLPFNNRIVSVRPFVAGVDQKTQIRWSVNGDFADWSGTGSGTLEVVETSNQALTGGIVLGSRCYLTRAREVIELIATGSLSPVFIPEVRVSGIGCVATHSMAAGDIYAFWLGPDEIYQWDGAQLKAVGGRTYNTITELVDYENLDMIQGVVYTPDSQYWLVVPPYIFIYDYRREIWDWDDVRSFEAIGILSVQDLITADLDHSELVVIGDSFVQTIREDPTINTYLGAPIDSYFETKDFLPMGLNGRQYDVSYDKWNTVWRIWFRGTPGELVEVAISTDKGTTYPTMQTVTVNSQGVGIFFSDVAWGVLRIRFRSQGGSVYSIQGPIMKEFTEAGVMLPP